SLALVSTIFLTMNVIGCQTLDGKSIEANSTNVTNENQIRWSKNGQVFQIPDDMALGENKSRVVFFRDSADIRKHIPIHIGIGSEKMFHTSLKDGYYSDVVVCSGPQTINSASILNTNEDVVSHSEKYNFAPKKTTYIKVSLSPTNQSVIQQIDANEAIPQLENIVRQSYQISRVSMTCNVKPKPKLIEEPVVQVDIDQVENEKRTEYVVNFNFDTNVVANNDYSKFEGLARFIESYPENNVILEGHTDSKGSSEYNLKLSQSRAERVKNILVDSYGVDDYRLRTVGYGETRPIDTNDTELGRLNNRRVMAVINP
ncbi:MULTISPECIES: OmpA family protein, partial [unclassified Psychrobacter]|uniref:OmpA family protein n=1 Tax=unclassified Psychrobacter TaxID=196806 RepID=UPI00402B8169